MARNDVSASRALGVLEEQGVPEAVSKKVGETYPARKPKLRDFLDKTIGAPLAQLVDIQWRVARGSLSCRRSLVRERDVWTSPRPPRRLDYVVRSSEPDAALTAVYYVKLFLAHVATDDAVAPEKETVRAPSPRFAESPHHMSSSRLR